MHLSPEEKQEFGKQLEAARSGVTTFYKYFLYVLIVGVTIFVIFLFQSFRRDASKSFLQFYFGAGYVLFLLWVVGQLFSLRARSPEPPVINTKSEIDPETGARRFTFSLGGEAPTGRGFSMGFGTNLSSLAKSDRPTEDQLQAAHEKMRAGVALDAICPEIEPRFLSWSPPQQQVYKAYLQGELMLRYGDEPGFREKQPG